MTVIKCSGCGREANFPGPLSVGANYTCSSCNPWERKGLKRRANKDKNALLVSRLEQFVDKPLSGHEDEWFELAKELGVDAAALDSLREVIEEQKWKISNSPFLYVRTTVSRRSRQWQDPFGDDGRLRTAEIFGQFTSEDAKFARLWTEMAKRLRAVTPGDISELEQTLSVIKDDWERLVICARALCVSREEFVSVGSAEIRRKKAAAWKRVDRNGPPEDLRKALRAALDERALREEEDDDPYEEEPFSGGDQELLDSCALTRSSEPESES